MKKKLFWILLLVLPPEIFGQLPFPAPFRAGGPVTLFDGSPAYTNQVAPCLEYAVIETGSGINGAIGLKLLPDLWHSPKYRLFCGLMPRQNFTAYSRLQFSVRAGTLSADANMTMVLGNWNSMSTAVRLRDYIPGGAIDASWRVATIPLFAFTNSTFTLASVEYMSWSPDSQGRVVYLDKIYLTMVPIIADVQVAITGDPLNDTYIFWNTDRPTTGEITYSSLPTKTNLSELVTQHSFKLQGLQLGATYSFTIKSADAIGNTAVSNGNIFHTLLQAP